MIIVDTSIWIDHLRGVVSGLNEFAAERMLLQHPFVTGEVAVGALPNRTRTLRALRALPQVEPVSDAEFHAFVESSVLYGTGIGFVDAHILAAASANQAKVWTRDRRLKAQADKFDLTFDP